MEERANRAQSLFYVGLFIVLAAAILSAAWPIGGAAWTIALTGAGALVALAGRLWLSRLQRLVRRRNTDLGTWATR
jgi:hypothetical protein